jgi:hypothetical protein
MLDSSPRSSVLTSLPSSVKQPLLDDTTIDSSTLRARVEIRRQYKRRVEKSRLAAASSSHNNFAANNDVEDRQGVGYDSLLKASTSDTDSITNIPTSMTSTDRTRSQSLQSLDEQKTFSPPNSPYESPQLRQQQQSIEPPFLPPIPQSSAWSESHRRDSALEDIRNNMRTPPPNKPHSNDRVKNKSTPPLQPKFKRSSTTESAASSTVVDDVLMDRALYIRENLRKYELQELAAEAERAADSGLEKFVGSASKYVEESPDQTPKYSERKHIHADSFAYSMVTPQRSRGLLELDPLEFTPSSYFSNTKKMIKVSALRSFSDVVPNFSDMHSNIRFHLKRSGVDASTLPEMGSRHQPLVKNDTIESDAHSQAPSVTSGSIASFSSYAASSLKGVVELLGRSRSNPCNTTVPKDFSIVHKSSSAMSSFDGENPIKPSWEASEEDKGIIDNSASEHYIKAKRSPPLFPPVPLQMARSADFGGSRNIKSRNTPPLFTSKSEANGLAAESYDSDDSSVELYGRKSPLNISLEGNFNKLNQRGGVESNVPFNQLKLKPALSRSRSAQAFPALDNSYREASNNNVSFEDPIGLRSCSPVDMLLIQKSQTKDSADETGGVRSIFDRLQQQFSASIDDFRHPMKTEEENTMFVSNYFYTEKDAKSRDAPNLKLDINPRKENDAYCVGNCGDDDMKLVSSCETLGKIVTSALEWVSTKKSDASGFSNRSDSATGFSNLYTDNNGHDREKRVFVPPRLSQRSVDDVRFASDDLRQSNNHYRHGTLVGEQYERIPNCSYAVCDLKNANDENVD